MANIFQMPNHETPKYFEFIHAKSLLLCIITN